MTAAPLLRAAGVLAGAVLLLAAAAAGAETWSTAELRRCVALEDDDERLACFDRLAAERLAEPDRAETGSRSYSTVMEGERQRHRDEIRLRDIRIVAFVREHRRGRNWRRYVSDDGRYWRLREDQRDAERELPFEAEVIPDPADGGGYLLRPQGGGESIRVLADKNSDTDESD